MKAFFMKPIQNYALKLILLFCKQKNVDKFACL